MVFGESQLAFYINNAQAVGQIIKTRLGLYQGEWFLDTSDGTPWNTQVLGNRTGSTRDPVIQARVLGTPNVANIANYNSQSLAPARTFNAAMSVNTTFGPVAIAAQITAAPSQRPTTQFVGVTDQTPTSVLVTWSAEPIFTLNDTSFGVLDSSVVLA